VQKQLAKTSNDAHGCTSTPERYPVAISNRKYVLIDTPGLNEGSVGAVPDAKAKKLLKSLLHELMSPRSDDIGLMVYCARRATHPDIIVKACKKFYSGICHKRVPVILIVEGWGSEQDMERWWVTNGKACNSVRMFSNYPSDPASQEFDHQHIPDDNATESSGFLRNLIAKHYSDLVVDTSRSEHGSRLLCESLMAKALRVQ